MKNLPDLGGMFQQMKVRDKLMEISDQSILGYVILFSLSKGTPLWQILKTIMDAFKDNKDATLNVVGEETMGMIIQLLSKTKEHA